MKISWRISASDVRRIRAFVETHKQEKMVQNRKLRYRRARDRVITRATFWRASIMGLVTTQQPSGPGTHVQRFLRRVPFALTYRACARKKNLRSYAEKEIRNARLRFSNRLAEMVATNFERVAGGIWEETYDALEDLRTARVRRKTQLKEVERNAANFIDEKYAGYGPKQARNLLQCMGLTKHEIPLDSRIMKWLNEFGFPIRLTAQALSDRNYYMFVLDAVQAMCERGGVDPFILDAAIFTSYDRSTGAG
jgi:thermostable 8-oxoguanine DNA glycosylase